MASQTAQYIYNIKLRQSSRNLVDRLTNRLISLFFSKLEKENPLVETHIGQFKLELPFSHQLPFILKSSPHYSTNLARIAKLVFQKYSDFKLIDIGANIGDSVALLRTEATFPILCIEGDDYFFSILKSNVANLSEVYLEKSYVGETTKEINAVSVEVGGTAHLNENQRGTDTIYIKNLATILNDYPLFKKAKMLKIDTDGFDNKIIRGSIDLLESAKPVLFFEYDPYFLLQQNEDDMSVFNTLISKGYQKLLIYENYGELMISADLDNYRLLEDITYFYRGRKGLQYCDICAFHEEDNDLFEVIRKSELNFFEQSRS